MSEINGFVKLSSEYIWNNGATILARIDEKRTKKKAKIISDKREVMQCQGFFERVFKAPIKEYTDDQVWKRMEYEAENTLLGTYPSYWVDNHYKTLENRINEIMKACQNSDEMLVASDLAHWLTICKTF